VFASFMPNLPEAYRKSPFLFLGNISPQLQLHVLGQIEKPRFVVIDTMDLWIDIARPDLLKVIQRTDMITINEFEARHLSGHKNLLKAAQILLCLGPRFVLVKKGENGSALFCKDSIFLLPAFPLDGVIDPTGAGMCSPAVSSDRWPPAGSFREVHPPGYDLRQHRRVFWCRSVQLGAAADADTW